MKCRKNRRDGKGLAWALALAALLASGAHADQVPLEAVKAKSDPFAQMALGALKFQRPVPISVEGADPEAVFVDGQRLAFTYDKAQERFNGETVKPTREALEGKWKLVACSSKGGPALYCPNEYNPQGLESPYPHNDGVGFLEIIGQDNPFEGQGSISVKVNALNSRVRFTLPGKIDKSSLLFQDAGYVSFECRLLDPDHLLCSSALKTRDSEESYFLGFERAEPQ